MKGNKPLKKKDFFPIQEALIKYLNQYKRWTRLPLQYNDMLRYSASVPLLDMNGNDTHWETVHYSESDRNEIHRALCELYAIINTDGDISVIEHLSVDRVDFCVFGNTQPFRVRIINRLNDNYDHFYIKKIDASRVYGLELEDLISPNKVNYLVDSQTIIEEHIAGIPGDEFLKRYPLLMPFDEIRIAKEFIKFNERCFIRLLGDMRAYNFIVDVTPDIEGAQYRIRSIDFDQQSYEGWKSFYLPQYFKENNDIIQLGFKHLNSKTVFQYQMEERSLVSRRVKTVKPRLHKLMQCMISDEISRPDKISQLREELAYHHKNNHFLKCKTMGEVVLTNLNLLLQKEFVQAIQVV